jgi:cell division protein FtsB
MIMLATFGVCVTVTMRTHAGMRSAEGEFRQVSAEVQTLRDRNAMLRHEVERLKADPQAIESAARERLNMVRANEVVVPLD